MAEEMARLDIFALPDIWLTKGWKLSLGGIPVAPVTHIGTPVFNRAIHLFRVGLTPEARAMPYYVVDNPFWHNIISERRHELVNHYAGNVPPYQHNHQARREFWHGHNVTNVLDAHDGHQGAYGDHQGAEGA